MGRELIVIIHESAPCDLQDTWDFRVSIPFTFHWTEGNLFQNKVVWSTEWLLHQAEFRLYHADSHGEDSALLCTFTGRDNAPVILCDRQVQVSGWPKVLWTRWISGRAVKPMTIRSSKLPVMDYRCSRLNCAKSLSTYVTDRWSELQALAEHDVVNIAFQ